MSDTCRGVEQEESRCNSKTDLGSSSSNDNMEIFSEIVSLAVLLRLTMKL